MSSAVNFFQIARFSRRRYEFNSPKFLCVKVGSRRGGSSNAPDKLAGAIPSTMFLILSAMVSVPPEFFCRYICEGGVEYSECELFVQQAIVWRFLMNFTSDLVRNVSISGHGGTGKTSLFERLLFSGGVIARPETVESGKTVSDSTP